MKLKSLTDEEIRQHIFEVDKLLKEIAKDESRYNEQEFVTFSKAILNSLLQAQLESCEREAEAELKKVKEEIEKKFGLFSGSCRNLSLEKIVIDNSMGYYSKGTIKDWFDYWKGKGIE